MSQDYVRVMAERDNYRMQVKNLELQVKNLRIQARVLTAPCGHDEDWWGYTICRCGTILPEILCSSESDMFDD